ncbi:MAG: hypothetical protein U0793_23540 [Gemmataceae bacterium]
MPVTAICPQCQATYKLGENLFGKQVRCKKCQAAFTVGKPAAKKPDKPDVKKTMVAPEDAIQEAPKAAPRPAAVPTAKAAKTAPQAAAPKPRPKVEDDEEIIEATAAPPRPTRDEDEGFVEASAAPPLRVPAPAPPPRPAFDDDSGARRGRDDERGDRDRRDDRGPRRPRDDFDDVRGGRRPRRDFDDVRKPRDDFEEEPAPKKSRAGLIIGIIVGVLVLAGGGVALIFILGKSDPNNDPEVAEKLEDLKARRDETTAINFFANYEKPEGQMKRKEVATALESALRDDFRIRFAGDDQLVTAYAKWATSENATGMSDILTRPGRRLMVGRDRIIRALAAFKDESAAQALGRIAVREFFDRQMALDGLASMGEPGEKELGKYVFDNDGNLRMAAQKALRDAGAKQDKFIDGAVRVLVDPAHPARDAAVSFLAEYPEPPPERSKEVAQKIVDVLGEKRPFNPNPDVLAKAAAKWAVKDGANVVIDAALAIMADKKHSQRGLCVNILRDIKSPPPERSKEVCEKTMLLIQERAFIVSDGATAILPVWLTKESVTAVAKAVQEADLNTNCEKLITALAVYKDTAGVPEAIGSRILANNPSEQRTAEKLLTGLAPAAYTKGLLAHLHDPNPFVRERVRNSLSKAGVGLEDMVKQTIQDLGSANADVRHQAVEFLAKNPAVPALRDAAAKGLNALVYEDNVFRRDQVFNALASWWNKESMALLCKTVNDPANTWLRHKSIETLAKMGEPALANNIAYRLKFSEDRFPASNALRSMGSKAEGYVAPYLLDTDSAVRNEALRVLEQIGTSASVPYFNKALMAYGAADRGFALSLNRIGATISKR